RIIRTSAYANRYFGRLNPTPSPAVQEQGQEVENECEQREGAEAGGHRQELEASADDRAQQIRAEGGAGVGGSRKNGGEDDAGESDGKRCQQRSQDRAQCEWKRQELVGAEKVVQQKRCEEQTEDERDVGCPPSPHE